ncbi:MAG: GTPase, partial [Acidobacteriota bacterium]
DYPFTTLVPQLGVVADGPLSDPFVLADLPGLIQGAAEGAGLGYQFLRHVERCRVLVHLVDLSGGTAAYDPDGADLESLADAGAELAALEGELGAFDPELLERRRLVVGSKLDAALPARRESLRAAARARDLPYLEISSVTRDGLEALRHALRSELAAARADSARADAEAADARSAAWPTPPHLQQSAAEARGEGEGE